MNYRRTRLRHSAGSLSRLARLGYATRTFQVFTLVVAVSACSTDPRTPLVVYSPHGPALLDAFEARFEAEYPEYDLQTFDLPSQSIPDRLRAERAIPQADVWFGASAVTFADAAAEGLLEPYVPSYASAIADDAHDVEWRWAGLYETPEIIAYSTAVIPESEAPRDWDDLLDPKWRNRILIRDPNPSDTMRTIFGSMILRRWSETNGPEGGFEWLRGLARNTKDYPTSWDGLLLRINRQEADVTIWNLPDVSRVIRERDYALAIVFPKSGSPVVTDAIAIVRGAPRAEGARLFYEFCGRPDNLAFAAEAFYRIPARNDLDRSTLPDWARNLEYKKLPMDWNLYRSNIKSWMTTWTSDIRSESSK